MKISELQARGPRAWSRRSTPREGRILEALVPGAADVAAAASVSVDPASQIDDHYDYSKVVVPKPWGYEYLLFQNESVAVWILQLRPGGKTSLHCHRFKQTSITVLSGEAECSTLESTERLVAGGVFRIGAGVFHRTTAISPAGTTVMEIEQPVNKRDLLRYKDDYGRENLGYESSDRFVFNLENYNYASFIDSSAYYNVTKRIGDVTLELQRLTGDSDLEGLVNDSGWHAMHILSGAISSALDERVLSAGDSILPAAEAGLLLESPVDAIIVRNRESAERLAELLVARLKQRGVREYFYVTDTAAAHLIDAIGRDPDLRSCCFHTEHAAALAAEAFGKATGRPGVLVVAAGAGASALTGVSGAWLDSTPLIVLSGQTRATDLHALGDGGVRQLANKELAITELARPVTKFAAVINDVDQVLPLLESALTEVERPRQGPVWLDIPIDLLGRRVAVGVLRTDSIASVGHQRATGLDTRVCEVIHALLNARRPVLLAGYGVRAAAASEVLERVALKLGMPVLTSRRGVDLLPADFPLAFGRPGTYGQRASNFILQNADLLIAIGSRLALPLIGRNHRAFARGARKIVVDIDAAELKKGTITPDVAIEADAGQFLEALERALDGVSLPEYGSWLDRCDDWTRTYPVARDYPAADRDGISPYVFIERLSEALAPGDVIVVDGGHSLDYVMQSFMVRERQRVISSPALEHQGFALPGALGAWLGLRGRIICLCDAKGLQRNVAELGTIAAHKLPIKVFVFNIPGDFNVQKVQAAYFGGRYVGSGTQVLDIAKLAAVYGLASLAIENRASAADVIGEALKTDGPVLCDVRVPTDHEIVPRVVLRVTENGRWTARPIEDMFPLLDRAELREQMIVDPLEEES